MRFIYTFKGGEEPVSCGYTLINPPSHIKRNLDFEEFLTIKRDSQLNNYLVNLLTVLLYFKAGSFF